MPAQHCSHPRTFEPLVEALTPELQDKLTGLRQTIANFPAAVVAYSGGVDSTLVAAIAGEQLGQRATAVTGISAALAPHLRREAQLQAEWMGVEHQEITTHELNDPAYASNPSERCYACKRELHTLLRALILRQEPNGAVVLDGVNLDDLGDHRPGIRAAQEQGVRSPLAELGISKAGVRAISRALGLPWWDKPAQPCLASRFPYGEAISSARLERVAAAEAWLRQHGFEQLRVRSQGESARIELPPEQLINVIHEPFRQALVTTFLDLGFTAVSLDLEGLISGKLNRGLVATEHHRLQPNKKPPSQA